MSISPGFTRVGNKAVSFMVMDLHPDRSYCAHTEANVVYLMCIVTQAEGEMAAERATTIDGVAHLVKVFEYLN